MPIRCLAVALVITIFMVSTALAVVDKDGHRIQGDNPFNSIGFWLIFVLVSAGCFWFVRRAYLEKIKNTSTMSERVALRIALVLISFLWCGVIGIPLSCLMGGLIP